MMTMTLLDLLYIWDSKSYIYQKRFELYAVSGPQVTSNVITSEMHTFKLYMEKQLRFRRQKSR